jgi:putative 3-ketosteroid-1-dehydrogenase
MSKVELSRRGFLKGTLAATGAAMTGTAAHAGDIPEKWQQPKCSGWSWEKPAAKIAPEQIKKTVDTDVVVIGAGLAGFAAALAAAQEGAKVVLVEKTRGWSCRGGHITAFNSSL